MGIQTDGGASNDVGGHLGGGRPAACGACTFCMDVLMGDQGNDPKEMMSSRALQCPRQQVNLDRMAA